VAPARIAVLGLGNVLMRDDAFGPYVVETLLATYEAPPDADILDLGTPGLDLTPFVTGRDALILVDTVKSTGRPGDLRFYSKDEILKHPPQPRLSPHDPGVKEALLTAEFAGEGPRTLRLVGVIPANVRMGVGLSPGLRVAVPQAVEAVRQELLALRVALEPRPEALAPDLWWERKRPAPVTSPPLVP